MKYMNKALSMLAAAAAVMSCQWDPADHDIAPVEEKLTLSASSENVVLLEENLKKDAVTFSWTEARDMGEDYMISYETKLDVLGNNFGSKTGQIWTRASSARALPWNSSIPGLRKDGDCL